MEGDAQAVKNRANLQNRTPEPQTEPVNRQRRAGSQNAPGTPGDLTPFDWADFEARYEHALADANQEERELLVEFDQLVQVCSHRTHSP